MGACHGTDAKGGSKKRSRTSSDADAVANVTVSRSKRAKRSSRKADSSEEEWHEDSDEDGSDDEFNKDDDSEFSPDESMGDSEDGSEWTG